MAINVLKEALKELEELDELVIESVSERNGEVEFLMFNTGELLYNTVYNEERYLA